MGCHKLTYSDNFSSLKLVYSKLSGAKNLFKYKYQWDLIHDPQSMIAWAVDKEEAAYMNSNMSKESIKNAIDLIRNDNIAKETESDLTLDAWSKGITANLELTSDFTLDYIEIEIKSGKNIGTEENPLLFEDLIINPKKLKFKDINAPSGQEGNFVKVYYNRLDKATPPFTDHTESDSLAISFVIKRNQQELFKDYIFNRSYSTFAEETINSSIESALVTGEKANPNGSACNICVREALNRIANNEVLFPKNKGKISRVGKANDIYCDFLRWNKNADYQNIKNSYVDFLLQDNIDWERDWHINIRTNEINNNITLTDSVRQVAIDSITQEFNTRYDNISIEKFRSNNEITEFELITNDITATVGNVQCQIPDFNYLQEQANKGVLIIGIRKRESQKSDGHYRSGHIIMIVPITETEAVENNRPSCQSTNDETIYYPKVLECGSDDKDEKWINNGNIQNMLWYRYK